MTLICERCDMNSAEPGDTLYDYCRECLDETLGPWPPWYVVNGDGWETWTVRDCDRRGPHSRPFEDWIEEGRVEYALSGITGTLHWNPHVRDGGMPGESGLIAAASALRSDDIQVADEEA